MNGKIIKGIGGFYYVHIQGEGIFECRARGIFRNRKEKPLVGDDVSIDIVDREKMIGNVTRICERKNSIIRPEVANVDQAMILFALASPEPNLNLLDRFLILMEQQDVPVTICFNKRDLVSQEFIDELLQVYSGSECSVMTLSAGFDESVEEVRALLKGKTTVLAGPSGVGKSSLMNRLHPEAAAQTGELSKKISRGKHTTRHSELFCLEEDTYVMDTPGFTSLGVFVDDEKDICRYYPEFLEVQDGCKFLDCVHVGEKICAVKDAVKEGRISKIRYENYLQIYHEVKNTRKY